MRTSYATLELHFLCFQDLVSHPRGSSKQRALPVTVVATGYQASAPPTTVICSTRGRGVPFRLGWPVRPGWTGEREE